MTNVIRPAGVETTTPAAASPHAAESPGISSVFPNGQQCVVTSRPVSALRLQLIRVLHQSPADLAALPRDLFKGAKVTSRDALPGRFMNVLTAKGAATAA